MSNPFKNLVDRKYYAALMNSDGFLLSVLFGFVVVGVYFLGYAGFREQTFPDNEKMPSGEAAYRSFQLFGFHLGDVKDPVWQLQGARWLAPLCDALAVPFCFGWIAALNGRQRDRRRSGHVVICGMGLLGSRYARKFRDAGREVVIIEKSRTNGNYAPCVRAGCHVRFGNAASEDMLTRINVKDAICVLGLANDDVNLQIRESLKKLVTTGTRDMSAGPLRAYLHFVEERLLIETRLDAYRERSLEQPSYGNRTVNATRPLSIDAFNMYELSAQLLLNSEDHRFFEPSLLSSPIKQLVFIGWDAWNQAIIIEAVKRWTGSKHWQNNEKLSVVIAFEPGKTVQEQWQPFAKSHHFLTDVCAFRGVPMSQLPTKLTKESLLFVCTEQDGQSVNALSRLDESLQGLPRPAMLAIKGELKPNLPTGAFVHYVQDEACMPDRLVNTLDEISRTIHEQYVRDQVSKGVALGSNPSMNWWEKLDGPLKQSNYRQAASLEKNLGQSSYQLVAMKKLGEAIVEIDDANAEPIAKREHERYCEERPGKPSWNAQTEEKREIARAQVRAWPWILAQQGFVLKKT